MIDLKDFFIGDTLVLDWDFVWTLPHFKDMENTQQNPRWHMEGSVREHTMLVVNNAFNYMEVDNVKNGRQKRLFILSALFHDVGKPKTTFLGEKDGNWHSYGHENVGSKIVREMLWDWDIYEREYIAHMVKWHMEPLFYQNAKNPMGIVDKITKEVPFKDIYMLKMCDLEGALQDPSCSTKERDKQILEDFLKVSEELHNIPWISMLKYFPQRPNADINNWVGCSGDAPFYNSDESTDVHMFIGLPGSGKNHYIDYLKKTRFDREFVVLSKDDIRVELGYCTEDEKIVGTDKQEKKVTEIFNKRLIEAVDAKRPVIINNVNQSRKRRSAFKTFLGGRKIRWHYWYIEAPTLQDNFDRRRGQISENVFYNMIQNFDFPEPEEYTNFTVVKQIKK